MASKKRHRILSALLACAMLATAGAGLSAQATSATTEETAFADSFKNANQLESSVWTRWWLLAGGILSEENIKSDLKTMAEAGITHVEVNNQNFYWTQQQGDTNYLDVFYWILKYADEYGLVIDWSTGDMYPAGFDTSSQYYDESLGMYKLDYYDQEVGEGLSGSDLVVVSNSGGGGWPWEGGGFPMAAQDQTDEEDAPPLDGYEKILSVTAAYLDADNNVIASAVLADAGELSPAGDSHAATVSVGSGSIEMLDIDDTSLGYDGDFEDGTVTVTPSDLTGLLSVEQQAEVAATEGSWKLFTFYKVAQTSFLKYIDYLSPDATRAWAEYWENDLLHNSYWTEECGFSETYITELFEKVSGNLFEDSLESFTMNYTDELFDAFQEVNGYAFPMDRMISMIVNEKIGCTVKLDSDADYVIDKEADRQLRNDYYNTLTALYNENHLGVYTEWAQSHGIGTKIQAAYNYTLDQDASMGYITMAENETLNAQDKLDVYRTYSGSAHAHGIDIISSESGANGDGKSYTCTWDDWLWHFNTQYAGGVNAAVLHGVDYQFCGWGTMWPGKSGAGATAGQCESMGQRMPYWTLMDDTITSYLAREQYVLQQGQPDIDLAVYYYAYDYGLAGDSGRTWWTDQGLTQAGYSYDFLGDSSLSRATFDGSVLFPEGARYKALVLNQNRTTDKGEGTGMIPVATAQQILALAKQGLQVVVVGNAPDKAAENRDNYLDGVLQPETVDEETGESISYGDSQVRAIMAELLALPNVTTAQSEADAVSALQAVDVQPDSAYSEPVEDLIGYHRSTEDADFYFLFNSSYTSICADEERQISTAQPAHQITTTALFDGPQGGVPYLLDCWTGEITRIADYTVTPDGKYQINLDIAPNDTMMIGIGTPEWHTDGLGGLDTATTDAERIAYDRNGNFIVTSFQPGSYTVNQSDGSAKIARISEVPEAVSLSDWSLSLTLYQANEEFSSGNAGVNNANVYEIIKTAAGPFDPVDAETGRLLPWIEISDELKGASGVGVYTATATLPDSYSADSMGYVLNFEQVTELFTVKINGVQVDGINQNYPSGDVSSYLVPGENTIEITVASGLFNAVKYYNTAESAAKTDAFSKDTTFADWWSKDGIVGTVSLDGYSKAVVDQQAPNTSILEKVIAAADQAIQSGEVDAAISSVQDRFYAEYDEAVAVLQAPASQTEVDNAWIRLMNTLHQLGFLKGDATMLETLYNYAASLDLTLFVNNDAKIALPGALAAAKEILDQREDMLASEIDSAADTLLSAVEGLRFKADKSVLEQVLAQADSIDTAAYTAETVETFNAAKAAADAVFTDENASQQEVDNAAQVLADAINSLQILEDNASPIQGDVTASTTTSAPKTGDSTPIAAAVALLAVALTGFVVYNKK